MAEDKKEKLKKNVKHCPIITPVVDVDDNKNTIFLHACFREQCAWWEPTYQMCAITAIPEQMLNLYGAIQKIRVK